LTLTAADTFWIVVDGWNTNSNGAYQLFMDHDIRCAGCPPPPPCVECPAGAYVSIEPTCFNGYEDQTNVGCVAAADYATDNVGNIFQGATEQILGLNLPAGTYFVATSTFAWTDNPCGEIRLTIESDVPLPAELTSFDAVPGDRKITLSWSTGSESNLDHFSLMRNGALIAEVNANNSATGGSYTWTDIGLTNGTTYEYTLVSMDLDGASNTLGTQSAAPNAGNASVTEYALYQNYPNPFNPETSISFDLVEDGPVKLTVFNSLGQSVAVLVDGLLTAGRHTVTFDGSALTSGLYFYRLDAADFTANHKMVLMK
jgi:hypothetical protein